MKLTNLTIDRKKWGRGRTGGSLLSPNTGKMCCLGFACLKAGATEDEILDQGMPSHISTFADLGWLVEGTGMETDAGILADINDSSSVWGKRKENKIAKIFAKHGCKVTFVN